jgi:hypothetical protein
MRAPIVCLRLIDLDAADSQKFIIFARCCIYNEVAKSSREYDQWRLSMMLSSFLLVAPQ